MKIEKLQIGDVEHVSALHHTYMNRGFLTTLGPDFLARLYSAMLASENAFCIVAREDSKIIGFVSGTKHVAGFYKEFIYKNLFSVGLILLPTIFSLNTMKKVLETLLYPVKKADNLPDAELLSIVVDEDYRGKGISKALFNRLVEQFASKSVNEFKVVVGAELIAACRFYESVGGVLHSEIEVHQGVKSRIYVWEKE